MFAYQLLNIWPQRWKRSCLLWTAFLWVHCPCPSDRDFPIIISLLKNSNAMAGRLELKNLSSPLIAAKLVLLINMPSDGHHPNTWCLLIISRLLFTMGKMSLQSIRVIYGNSNYGGDLTLTMWKIQLNITTVFFKY